jgi:short-subunit dehydrogenase
MRRRANGQPTHPSEGNDMQTTADDPASARRVALVTGASAGLGAAFARELARRGHDVVLVARRADRMDAIAAELRSTHGVRTCAVVQDLAAPGACERVMARAAAFAPTLDVLVNNAGYGLRGGFMRHPWEAHRDFLTVMLADAVELTHRALPGMLARGHGRIVNVSSVAGFAPPQRGSLYGAVKRALTTWSESLSLELAGTGVHACAACPGFTRTEFHDAMGNRAHMDRLPAWLWSDAETVARRSLDACDAGRPVEVIGGVNRAIVGLCAVLPGPVLRAIAPRDLMERGGDRGFGG